VAAAKAAVSVRKAERWLLMMRRIA